MARKASHSSGESADPAHPEQGDGGKKADAGAFERKQSMLTHSSPSHVRSIASAVVAKDGDVYFLTEESGCIPLVDHHGLGLYYHDCRYLDGYELQLGGRPADVLAADAGSGSAMAFQLANGPLDGDGAIPMGRVGVRWNRVVDGAELAVREVLTFRNYGTERVDLDVGMRFAAGFDDIMIIRGLLSEKLGRCRDPAWQDGRLVFGYDGSDGVARSLTVELAPGPDERETDGACYRLGLDPQQEREIRVCLWITEGGASPPSPRHAPRHGADGLSDAQREARDEWPSRHTVVSSDSEILNRVLRRSLLDVGMLRTSLKGEEFFAAGVPWFVTLFGRDSIITALQTLAFDSSMAEQTLRLLARLQGREMNAWKDEQPGKILHELRVGELARRGLIPYTPYYGSIDATPLFLILLGLHAAWSGELTLFRELRENVGRALEWIDRHGDVDGDGYVEYESQTKYGLVNQGWKDSGDAIVNADGSLATPPIALVEVQAYVYRAWRLMAGLHERDGDGAAAARLNARADALRERFNRDFWLEDEGFYAMALQGKADDPSRKQPCAVPASNPGHALWCGIADPDRAGRTVTMLMDDDLFSGWGVRTLSKSTRCYNPVGYHLGSVWPHDNAILAAGFRRYGHDAEALRVFAGIREAASWFSHDRLPELFTGFRRSDYDVPVPYPVACHPQAWAAGSIPFFVQTLLGLEADAFSGRLHVVRPILPEGADWVELQNLRVGRGSADLCFRRKGHGVEVQVLRAEGVEVRVEDGDDALTARAMDVWRKR